MWTYLFALTLLAIGPPLNSRNVHQQPTVDTADSSQNEAVITKLSDPIYPLLARTAGVHGDVVLTLRIRSDGSVESVEYLSGPLLLTQAATDSAKASRFACRQCTDAVVSYSLTYTFQLSSNGNCCNSNVPQAVSVFNNHVWTTASEVCLCDPSAVRKVRSIKCLYLWKCATH